jgi:hypothetical protein
MGSREGLDVPRKLEGPTGWVFGGILETVGGTSLTLSRTRLEMGTTFVLARCLVQRNASQVIIPLTLLNNS